MPIKKQLNSVLVKPAGPDCNLACTYCFYLEKADLFSETIVHRMNEKVLEEMIKQVLSQSGSNVSFGWQGGEPTLMGLQFYEKAVEFQKKYGVTKVIGNGLQTNGILLDKKWAKFLNQYKFLVGLSLDGPEHIHNHYRLNRGGKGSWQQVFDKVNLLLDNGVEVNALSVVNDYSVKFPEEIYQFHKDNGLSFMQFIPCVESHPQDATKAAPFSVTPLEYGKFLCKLFDLWKLDFVNKQPTTSIRFFDSVFFHYVDLEPPECTLLPECGIYVVVEHNGDVYSCDFFVEPEWKLGNVLDSNLTEMLNSQKQNEFGKMKVQLPVECKTCEWLRFCYGGCTKDRIRDPRDQKLNHFCQSYKMFYKHADPYLKKLAADWKQQQAITTENENVQQTMVNVGKIGRNDPCPCGSGKKYKKCCGLN